MLTWALGWALDFVAGGKVTGTAYKFGMARAILKREDDSHNDNDLQFYCILHPEGS